MNLQAEASATVTNTIKKSYYEGLTPKQLIAELKKRDKRIYELEKQLPNPVDPAKAEKAARELKVLAEKGIKKLMTWRPSCNYGTARFAWSSLCDEATFRAFMGIQGAEKTKGKKMKVGDFEDLLGCFHISKSIRYSALFLRGEHVNITYSKARGQIKINGSYGL